MKEEKRKPGFDARFNGVRLAVWANETDGRRWYSAAPSRRVVEGAGKETKYYSTFNGAADLVLLRAAIDRAIDWINRQEDESSADEA
jgi:hypothetical protein